MNKLFTFFLILLVTSCGKPNAPIEKCADSVFVLTNHLMTQRLPSEAQSEEAIKKFISQSFQEKTQFDYYNALIKICENENQRDPKKFREDYE